jgi:hypothetical protein
MSQQLILIPGYYRCQNCGRLVDHVRKERRWRICENCWQAIVAPTNPEKVGNLTDEEWEAREAYARWLHRMEQRYPARRSWRRPPPISLTHDTAADYHFPFCECGRPRRPVHLAPGELPTLFGGPFHKYCPVCEARLSVEIVFRYASTFWPGRDDEDILDLLSRSHPEAFEVGVLPAYWWELRLKETGGQQPENSSQIHLSFSPDHSLSI